MVQQPEMDRAPKTAGSQRTDPATLEGLATETAVDAERLPRSRPAVRQRGTGTPQVRGQACTYQAEVCSAADRTTISKKRAALVTSA